MGRVLGAAAGVVLAVRSVIGGEAVEVVLVVLVVLALLLLMVAVMVLLLWQAQVAVGSWEWGPVCCAYCVGPASFI